MGETERKSFGNKIRVLRLRKGLTQEQLAEAAALHPTYIGGVERGQRNVGFDNILKIAAALKEPPSVLFEESQDEDAEQAKSRENS